MADATACLQSRERPETGPFLDQVIGQISGSSVTFHGGLAHVVSVALIAGIMPR